MKKAFFLILLIIATGSCHFNENPTINLSAEDEKIVELAYSQTYMYPSEFEFQPDLDGSIYYENTVSIDSSEISWIELHTNDQQQAKDWSEISSDKSSYYRDLVSEKETEKYFEFKRVNPSNTNDVILSILELSKKREAFSFCPASGEAGQQTLRSFAFSSCPLWLKNKKPSLSARFSMLV